MFFLVYYLYLEVHFLNRNKITFLIPIYLSTTCWFSLRATAQFLEILGAVHTWLIEGNTSHLLSSLLFLLHTPSFFCKCPLFLRKQPSKAEVSATCSFFMVQTPGACSQIKTSFCLMFSFSHLLYPCCYSLLMISSSVCFSASNIFVLCYFELLVISKVSEHCPVQHLFMY